jgi:hypothetical protein
MFDTIESTLPANWDSYTLEERLQYLDRQEASKQVRTFDYPLDNSKLSRKNPTVNDKYINLIKAFFAIREECHRGNLGTTSKSQLKELKSIEKFEKVFMLRFTNCRPQFYSFKKAAELTGLALEDINNIKAKPNGNYEGIRFDITDFFKLIEETTKTDWEQDIYSATLFDSDLERLLYRDVFYQDKMMQLKEHYCFRKLCTYENERTNPNKVEYAELTSEDKSLPDWYIHFRYGTFDELKRKEQLVAFFNNYDDRYDSNVDYQVESATQEQIEVHKSWKNKERTHGK